MPKLELEKLEDFLEKYIKMMKDEVSYYDEKLKSEEINKEQQSEFQFKKQELETKIEKTQSYLDKIRVPETSDFIKLGKPKKHWGSTEGLEKILCQRYAFRYDNKSVTLDIAQELNDKLELKSEDVFYVAKETLERNEVEGAVTLENETEIFLQRHLIKEETNKGKIAGTFGGVGMGAASGAAAGAGAMFFLSPYTLGFSLTFAPTAATIGAIAGGLSGGTTGLMAGSIFDKILNSKAVKTKEEIKVFLEDYKTMIEKESYGCQNTIDNEVSTSVEKEKSRKQKENYDNEIREIEAYIENSNN